MNEEKFQIKVLVASLAIVVAAVLASNNGFADTKTANTTINANVGSAITITSLDSVNINVTPAASGPRLSSAHDTVTVNTNNSTGYNLTIQMNTAETSLLNGTNAITKATGSLAVPAALGANTWGYRVAGSGGFGAGAAAESNVAASAYTWAGVPANGAPDQVKSTSGVADDDTTDIWYAIMADTTKPSGTYTGKVTYSATTK